MSALPQIRRDPAEAEVVWFDGALVPLDEARVPPFTHTLHYGSGVFEGIRAYATPQGAAVFRLDEHLARLYASARAYGLRIPYSAAELARAVCATIRANAAGAAYVRPLVFYGARGISLAPAYSCPTHVLIALKPLDGSLVGEKPAARLTISSWRKTPSAALPSTVKACGHYANSVLALHEAYARGFDEALMLNVAGHVAEGTGENVFIVANGRLITNDAASDILEGITRASVIELARERGLRVDVRAIGLEELFAAEEIFLTGTAAEIVPVGEIDGRTFTAPGPITAALCRDYAAAVRGEQPRHRDWITHVQRCELAP